MKPDRIAKMYENLNSKEKALLCFHYSTVGNTTEADRIAAMVPWRTYKMREAEFLDWLQAVHCVAEFWGWQHWRLQAKRLAALGGMQIMLQRNDLKQIEAFTEAFEQWEAQLLALDAALDSVCRQHGINAHSIRAVSGGGSFRALNTFSAPDPEYLEEIESGLLALLEGVGRHSGG